MGLRTIRERPDVAGVVLLVVVTALWGTTFVVIKDAVVAMSPGVLVLARFAVAALALSAFVPRRAVPGRAGLELGLWLCLGYAAQAQGLQYTTASRSAFITSVSVVLVPVIASLLGRRVHAAVLASAGIAFAGVALLTVDGAAPNRGDAFTVVTAVAYAVYVLRLEAHAGRQHALPLTVAQLWGVVPFAAGWVVLEAVVAGAPRLPEPGSAWLAVAYLALLATAVATLLQTEGQRRVAAPQAGVVYTLEPVWAAGFAAILLGERLGPLGVVGALLVVSAVLLSQAPALWAARRRAGRTARG